MGTHNFLIFAFASLMLNLTPGADMLYVATRSTGQGSKAGIVSALGIMGGCMVHVFAAVIGLSALIASSALAFSIVKWLGAGYLVYLGISSILGRKNSFATGVTVKPMRYSRIFWQGVLTNVLNPKVALFFLAFLPQFLNLSGGRVYAQVMFLGIWFNLSGTLVNLLVALLFGRIGGWLSGSAWFTRWQAKFTGMILLILGVKLAISSRK